MAGTRAPDQIYPQHLLNLGFDLAQRMRRYGWDSSRSAHQCLFTEVASISLTNSIYESILLK